MSRFETVELPNGALMNRRHFFSSQDDIVLRDPSGKVLVNEEIDFVCFDERFVRGSTFGGKHPDGTRFVSRFFIYEKGQDEAIYSGDSRYDAVRERSGLQRRDGCGIEGARLGWGILIKDRSTGGCTARPVSRAGTAP